MTQRSPHILIAGYQHETNTFAPSLADWAAFQTGEAGLGAAIGIVLAIAIFAIAFMKGAFGGGLAALGVHLLWTTTASQEVRALLAVTLLGWVVSRRVG